MRNPGGVKRVPRMQDFMQPFFLCGLVSLAQRTK